MSMELRNPGNRLGVNKNEDGASALGAETEQKEFVKPELSIELNKAALASLSERYPEHNEMFERLGRLPGIKFERGKVNFIFGPNGSGKSTLANAVFLAAKIALLADRTLSRPARINRATGEEFPKPDRDEVMEEVREQVLRPGRMSTYEMAELIGMAAAPRLVEEGALTIPEFKSRHGYGGIDQVESDTPIVHRIAVQDMLGEQRNRERDYMNSSRNDGVSFSAVKSSYAEEGASARQMIEVQLRRHFEGINPGSIVVMDEAAFGLSPKRQEDYIKMLEQFAKEKDLIVIAPENSGYAFDSLSLRIDLESPEQGLHMSEARNTESRAGVTLLESKEMIPNSTMEFGVNQGKMQELAEKNPRFGPMLEYFAKLPSSFAFGPGKTEIFADNGGGKTTMLGVIYLLMEIERSIQSRIEMDMSKPGREIPDREELRKEITESLVTRPYQTEDKLFIESLGLAREIISSGAITLKNIPTFPRPKRSKIEGMGAPVKWINLLDISGEIKRDNFNMIGFSDSKDAAGISAEIKKYRPDRVHGSTRQTAENLLITTIEQMPEGGFLFVDEIDGGISPSRQLLISHKVNTLARERNITVVATSNSYEGYKYRLTPSFDLSTPEIGINSPEYKFKEMVA